MLSPKWIRSSVYLLFTDTKGDTIQISDTANSSHAYFRKLMVRILYFFFDTNWLALLVFYPLIFPSVTFCFQVNVITWYPSFFLLKTLIYNFRKEHFGMCFKSRLAHPRKADLHPWWWQCSSWSEPRSQLQSCGSCRKHTKNWWVLKVHLYVQTLLPKLVVYSCLKLF